MWLPSEDIDKIVWLHSEDELPVYVNTLLPYKQAKRRGYLTPGILAVVPYHGRHGKGYAVHSAIEESFYHVVTYYCEVK